ARRLRSVVRCLTRLYSTAKGNGGALLQRRSGGHSGRCEGVIIANSKTCLNVIAEAFISTTCRAVLQSGRLCHMHAVRRTRGSFRFVGVLRKITWTDRIAARKRYVLFRSTRIFADFVVMTNALRAAIHLGREVEHPIFFKVGTDRKKVTHLAMLLSDDVAAMVRKRILRGRRANSLISPGISSFLMQRWICKIAPNKSRSRRLDCFGLAI